MEIILVKQPHEISFTGNAMPYSFSVFPYGSNERSQDIRLIVKVMVELAFNSGIFAEVKSQQFFPNDAGMVNFDVKTLVDPYLEYYTPRTTLGRPVQALQQRKRYRIDYLLQKDGLPVGSFNSSDILFALKGGLAYDEWHPVLFFEQQILANKMPLHFNSGREKYFAHDFKFLYWLYPYADNAQQTVYLDVLLNDNSTLNYAVPKTIFGGKWSVFCCPIGINQLGIDIPAGLFAVSVTVSVRSGVTVIVAPFTYYLLQQHIYAAKQLLYRNSLGGIETLTLRGQVDFEADFTKQQAQQTVPPASYSNLILSAQQTDSSGTEQQKFKADTGFITRAAADKMRDLFLSTEKYEYDGKLYPVSILTKNTKFFTNKDQLISLLVEWQRAYVNEFYTPAHLLQAAACPAVERFSVKQINKRLLQIMYACQIPYDMVQVEVTTSGGTENFTYLGNARTVRQQFNNPLVAGTENITVRCRTVCNADADPMDVGPWKTINLDINANSLPIANDDYFVLPVGHNAPVVLAGNVLANDSDPDGDAIEVIPVVAQATNDGGTISIAANGVVTYQPPTSAYTGQDYYDYNIRETPVGTAVPVRVYVNVGSTSGLVYVKKVERNISTIYSGFIQTVSGEIWFDFFSDPAGTVPLDVTTLGVNVLYDHRTDTESGCVPTSVTNALNIAGGGTQVKVYEGTITYEELDPLGGCRPYYEAHFFSITPNSAYIII
jgi:hypothetical protein